MQTPSPACYVCGRPRPEDGSACPADGNTFFVLQLADVQVPERDPLLGQRIGDYEIQTVVGAGGMGIVYGGIQPVIKKRVAIKVLRPELASDASLVKRLVAEAEAVNAIGHRNIIDIFGLGQLPDGRTYIIMEFLEGATLDAYVALRALRALPQLEAIELLIDICTPLIAAHGAGVIHRDLKPSNIFLVKQPDGARHLKLLDFGLARRIAPTHSGQTSVGQVAGTPNYMAPEQCRGLEVTPAVDLYALGVIAFELLTGRLPFFGATPMDTMALHLSAAPEPPSKHVPELLPRLDRLVLDLLSKDPARRPPSADAVRVQLKALGQELRTVGAPSTRTWTEERPAAQAPPRSARRALFVGAGLALAAIVGLVLVLVTSDSTTVPPLTTPTAPPSTAPTSPPSTAPPTTPTAPPTTPAVSPATPTAPPTTPTAPPTTPSAPRALRPARRPAAPPAEELNERITKLSARLKAATPSGAEPDRSALRLLDRQRLNLSLASTPAQRVEIARSLDAWEKQFLRK